jgi:hypothetical protein
LRASARVAWAGRPRHSTALKPWLIGRPPKRPREPNIRACWGRFVPKTNFDGSKIKLPKTLARKGGEPNAYVVGADSVRRYFTVMAECAKAGLADLDGK